MRKALGAGAFRGRGHRLMKAGPGGAGPLTLFLSPIRMKAEDRDFLHKQTLREESSANSVLEG